MLQPLTVLFPLQSDLLTCGYLSVLSQDNENTAQDLKSNHKVEFIAQITRRAVLAKRSLQAEQVTDITEGFGSMELCDSQMLRGWVDIMGGYSGKVHGDWQVFWTASVCD